MTAAPRLDNEAGYVFRDRHPERGEVYRRYDEASAAARARLDCRLDLRYGGHARQRFDLFPAGPGAPLLVFIHGGYWQSLDKERFSFVASALVKRGFTVALPAYPLAPEVRVEQIVRSVDTAFDAIVATLDAPPPFWIACGHSAGGHLAAMLAIARSGGPIPLAACIAISGIFDLEPLIRTSLNRALALDLVSAQDLSPCRKQPADCRLLAYVGADETGEFDRQSRDFARHWRRSGAQSDCVALRNRNHYTILSDLLEQRSSIAEGIVGAAEAFRRGE
ncbi:MAG: alpha/beta hydrolase [Rhizobiaceae bacterium]|nr:alpha/beta hydrolase [Rhizobiaceae bacterium]